MQDLAFIHEKYKQSLSDTYGYRHVFEELLIDTIHKNGVRTVEGDVIFALKPEVVSAITTAIKEDEELDDALKYSILSIIDTEMINEFFGQYSIWNSVDENDGYNWKEERLFIIFENIFTDELIKKNGTKFRIERKGEGIHIILGDVDLRLIYGGEDGAAERLNDYLGKLIETSSKSTWLNPDANT